jgi:hypothetical protein
METTAVVRDGDGTAGMIAGMDSLTKTSHLDGPQFLQTVKRLGSRVLVLVQMRPLDDLIKVAR